MEALVCATADDLFDEYAVGAGAALIAQEALTRAVVADLGKLLADQPPWSDFPIIVLTARAVSADLYRRNMKELDELGNVTPLERPIHPSTLVSSAASALRARRRQYHSRDVLLLREREVKQRDQFLAMLGHELRNPLAAIMNAKILMDRLKTPGMGIDRPLGIIDRQIRHLTQLVDDLLDVSRVTSGKIVLKRGPTDLVNLVRVVTEEVSRARGDGRVELTLKLPSEPLTIMGDALRVEQVVSNILTNAFKYTPQGQSIEVALERDGELARLRVTDTGVGMSPETLATVFEPFTQADGTLDRSQGGMGLGLTVVHSLVALHGGTVHAASDGLGKGSQFVVCLPLCQAPQRSLLAARSERTPSSSLPALGSARRVLIIEDSADIRESMQMLLTDLGHEVQVAGDGREGLDLALAGRPDVVLVDIGLPLIDGYEVARRLRAELGHRILLVALTGYGQPDDQQRARQAGFDRHFTKPVDVHTLHQVMSTTPDAPAPLH